MKIALTQLFILCFSFTYSQNKDSVMAPMYSGGEEELFKYLFKNIHHVPSINTVKGVVYTSFIIDSNGYLDSVWVVKGINYSFDQEVLKLIKKMDKWQPARIDNRSVNTLINLPIGIYHEKKDSEMLPETYNQQVEKVEFTAFLDEFMTIRYIPEKIHDFENNNKFDIIFQKGIDAINSKNYEEALICFNTVYRGDPLNPDILFNRGLVKHYLGKSREACKDWEKAQKYGDKKSVAFYKKYCFDN